VVLLHDAISTVSRDVAGPARAYVRAPGQRAQSEDRAHLDPGYRTRPRALRTNTNRLIVTAFQTMTTSLCLTHPACPPRSGPPPRLRARRRGIRLLGVWLLLAGAAGARAAEPPALEPAPQEFPSVLDNGAAQADVRAGEAENLEDVYTAALHNDHTLAAAQATYRAGLEEEVLARAELLPSVDASSDYREEFTEARGQFPAGGQLFPNSTDTDTGSFAFAFNLSQPVFDLPAWFRFQRGRALSERAEAEFAAAQQDLILRVTEAYFEVLSSRVNLRAARARETAFRSQLEQARQRFEVGLIAVTDVHEARAAYDLAVAERLANEGEVGIALEQLSVLTGESHRALWRLQEDYPVIDPEPLDTDQWVEFAVENSYDIKTAVHARRAADEAARAASAEHLPKVELSLGYNESNSDLTQEDVINDVTNQFSSDRNNRFIGLAVEVPLFAGGGISARRRQAAAEASTATTALSASRWRCRCLPAAGSVPGAGRPPPKPAPPPSNTWRRCAGSSRKPGPCLSG